MAIKTRTDDPQRRMARWALLITAAGLAIRLIGLGQHSYWFDEGREVLRALTPWPDVLLVTQGTDPPLYRLLLFPLASVSTAEFWLRLPSTLFGAASIYLAFVWLSALREPVLGLLLAGLLAVAPVEIYYAQEVSQYSLTVLLALLVLIAFERAARPGRWRDWALLTVVGLLSMYSYYGLALLFPVPDLDLAWRVWRRRPHPRRVWRWIGFQVLMGFGALSLYFLMLRVHLDRFTTNKQMGAYFAGQGLRGSLCLLLVHLKADFARFFTIPWSPQAPDWIPYSVAILFGLGLLALWWRSTAGRRIVLILLGTVAILYVANGLGLYPFGNRYALMLTPLLFLPLAAALQWLWRWRPLALLVGGLLLILMAAFWPNIRLIPNPWLDLPREELRPVVEYVREQAGPADVIYVYYGAGPAYQVYQPEPLRPTTLGSWFRSQPLEFKVDEIQSAAGDAPRLWLVMSHIYLDEDQELLAGLAAATPAWRPVDEFRRQNAAAILLERVDSLP